MDAEVANIDKLRDDGPTPEEWASAGMKPEDYPPKGFAAKPPQKQTPQSGSAAA
jgi:hypothetical protein